MRWFTNHSGNCVFFFTFNVRDGRSPTRASNKFRSPDTDNETIPCVSLQVLPTCWCSMPVPRFHVVIFFLVSISPMIWICLKVRPITTARNFTYTTLLSYRLMRSQVGDCPDPTPRRTEGRGLSRSIYNFTDGLTMVPVCALSVNSPSSSPVLPSYKKALKSEPTLAKWSPDGENLTSCTNLVWVLMICKFAADFSTQL